MKTKKLHRWDLSYSEAIELQKRLACEVQFAAIEEPPKLIAGLDCALSKGGQQILAAVVVMGIRSVEQSLWGPSESFGFEVIETASATRELTFPYIPGLLSFRESPVCIEAVEKLKNEPDAFLIDGQGIAHPRRLGLAAHLGLFFDKPTIGCAKSRLTGQFKEPPLEKGGYTLLKDIRPKAQDSRPDIQHETIGAVVRTRTNVEPVFVSVGNKCRLEDAIEITLSCTTKYRLPEPTRLAHQTVGKLKLET
ncbi:MAG: endonuclease V [Phycisphaerales bacterium]|nr:MAG: endonuclease V [Phycisphaerales bacterium]